MSSRLTAPFLAVLALTAAAAACEGPPRSVGASGPAPAPLPQALPTQAAVDDAARLAPSLRALALDLHHRVAVGDDNTVVSPASVAIALGMAQLGARGTTADELAHALHLSTATGDGAALAGLAAVLQGKAASWELASANRLWAAESLTLRPDYVERTGASLARTDFAEPAAAARIINAWIAAQTRDRITDLISPAALSASTRLVITNALYLKAAWRSRFSAGATEGAPFTALDGSRVATLLMHQRGEFALAAHGGAHAVALPYAGGALSFIAILPDAPADFRRYEQELDGARLGDLLDHLAPAQVSVSLPRFEVRASTPLRDALEALGVKAAFSDHADFSAIAAEPLRIDAVIHQGYVRVDESGTEAAAATAAVLVVRSIPPPSYDFRADRPFLYVILHNTTGAILFIGRMVKPAPIAS
ncbi:MAG: serpin family protein [Deltaproteobacteria bacterium]|nr:serpin family protein [Deltaproteobacteria bacterium]